jgi:DNA-damage-inducible protein D
MTDEITLSGPHKDFESIRKIDENGVEFWDARELTPLLGYVEWRKFEETIKRACRACVNSGQNQANHFVGADKMVEIGSGSARKISNYKLDRYACYLIAQNGDSRKPEIAQAQTYFAIQTRKQEIFDRLPEVEKRIFMRGEVSVHNKELFKTAKRVGVSKFGLFNDAGYRGLYGMPLTDIEKKKGVKRGELLDRAGASELAANLFRITQTDEKIKKDNVHGQDAASRTHFVVGDKVRRAIKDIGGTVPEQLPPERHIKIVKKEVKQLARGKKKLLKN